MPLAELGALAGTGFDYAELRASEIAQLPDAEFEALVARLGSLRLRVPVANVFLPPDLKVTGPDADEVRQAAYVRTAFARLARLGVVTLVFGSGAARSHPESFPREDAWRQLVAFCKRLGPEARRHGLTIAVEPLRRQESNLVNSVAEGLQLVEAVADPNLALTVDLFHVAETGEDPAVLLKAGARVRHVHVANPKGRVFPLRAEEYDYGPFFTALRAIGYGGAISIEARSADLAAEAPRSIALVRALAGPPEPPSPRSYRSSPVDTAHGDRESLPLWPAAAPLAAGAEPQDRPKLTVYRAPGPGPGAAAVVLPGGGYRTLASDHEGRQVAEWLNALGVSAFVLQYRLGPRYRHPAPLLDAQRALRLVRSRGAELGVDPARLGVVGFSAGGHLAASAGTRFDDGVPDAADPVERASSRPDFMVLGYPVIQTTGTHAHRGSREHLLGDVTDEVAQQHDAARRVTSRAPPAFLFHTGEDKSVPVENSLAFYQALRAAGVPAELHVFPKGAHGVGLAPQDAVLSQWPRLCAAWLRSLDVLDGR